ncbi:MAG: hypothetical protein Q7U57_19725 [Methylovulum sp.]|nr:hypothetical protein [Methylovulum sp.]
MIKLVMFFLLLVLSACAVMPPKNSDDLCATFTEEDGWRNDAQKAYQKWGVPIPVLMAIMHQESHFVADAKPPRPWLLGIIPWFRDSSAYGYAQAKDEAWDDYLDSAGDWWADRDEFADSADFIGWYCHTSFTKLHIAKNDAKNLYLAYHEGHSGYQRKTYLRKAWLRRTADKVAGKAVQFQKQLKQCKMRTD